MIVSLTAKLQGLARTVLPGLATAVIVLGVVPAIAHVGSGADHLWADHIKPMADPGTINAAGNPVHWTKLRGVPDAVADGSDGGIRQAGIGLDAANHGQLFEVSRSEVQARQDISCPAGSAIRSLGALGDLKCSKGPALYSAFKKETGIICNAVCTEGSRTVPAGSYVIFASIILGQTDDDRPLSARCDLVAEGDSDSAFVLPGLDSESEGSYRTIALQVVHTFASPGAVSLNCTDRDIGDTIGRHLKLRAIRVNSLTNVSAVG